MRKVVRMWAAVLAVVAGAAAIPAAAAADSLLYRCGGDICQATIDGSASRSLTTGGSFTWLSATPDGSRMAVTTGTDAFVLDGSGRPLGGALPKGGATLVAQIAPDGSQVATLELLGELAPPPSSAPPGSPPTLGFHPYLFTVAPDGSSRDVVARDVVDTAWLGGRLLRDDNASQAPFARGICLLASNTDFHCERDVARDPANDLSAPAVSPDGGLVAVASSPPDQARGTGPIALYAASTGALVRTLTNGADGLPGFSSDGRQVVFNRGNDIYAIAVDGAPGSERRLITGGLQPVWVTAAGPAACAEHRSVRPIVRGKSVTVRACAPFAGRVTVTLERGGHRVARRTVSAPEGGVLSVRFRRPSGSGALRATVSFAPTSATAR
jgi:WD40-like Beta Propeller Repeat